MKITALEPQASNAERVNVYVDGRFLLGASATVVLQMGLEGLLGSQFITASVYERVERVSTLCSLTIVYYHYLYFVNK